MNNGRLQFITDLACDSKLQPLQGDAPKQELQCSSLILLYYCFFVNILRKLRSSARNFTTVLPLELGSKLRNHKAANFLVKNCLKTKEIAPEYPPLNYLTD